MCLANLGLIGLFMNFRWIDVSSSSSSIQILSLSNTTPSVEHQREVEFYSDEVVTKSSIVKVWKVWKVWNHEQNSFVTITNIVAAKRYVRGSSVLNTSNVSLRFFISLKHSDKRMFRRWWASA